MSVMTALGALLVIAAPAVEPGFVSLFDGKTLNGWIQVDKRGSGYLVEDGKIVCPSNGGANLYTDKDYANFILRFEFRMEEAGNNGIGVRCPSDARDCAYQGMEIQILDSLHPKYKDRIKPAQHHGSVYDVIPARPGFLKKAWEWNEEEIVADGRKIKVTLNGTVILDADLDSVQDPEVLKKHPGLLRTTGRIGLLGHDSRVEFRNIRVKVLP
jgi:hypothetical protein